MIKARSKKKSGKVGQRKTKVTKPGSKKRTSRKPMDPVKVREEIKSVVAATSRKIAEAVATECMKGQLAPTKYLWEMTGVFPVPEVPSAEEEKPKEDEHCGENLMRMLIEGLQPPAKTDDSDVEDEDDDESDGQSENGPGPGEKKSVEEPVKEDPGAVLA